VHRRKPPPKRKGPMASGAVNAYSQCRNDSFALPKATKSWLPFTISCERLEKHIRNRLENPKALQPEITEIWNQRGLHILLKQLRETPESAKLLERHFYAFAKLLFGHGLITEETCGFSFIRLNDPAWEDILGYTNPAEDMGSNGSLRKAWVHILEIADQENQEKRADEYLGTIVHELAHALTSIYVCRCQKRCSSKMEDMKNLAKGPHGYLFQVICSTAETFLRTAPLDLRSIDTCRHRELARDLFDATLGLNDEFDQFAKLEISAEECADMEVDYEKLIENFETFQDGWADKVYGPIKDADIDDEEEERKE